VINSTAAGARLLKCFFGAALLCAGWMAAPPASVFAEPQAALWYVSGTGTDASGCGTSAGNPCKTISYLLMLPAVAAGDQINVTSAITDNFTLAKSVAIAGATGASIDGNGARIIQVNAGVNAALSNLTLRNGGGNQNGGLIHNAGVLTVSNTLLTQSTLDNADGGAIYNAGAASIVSSILSSNSARYGGAIENQGTLVISASLITNNQANSGGSIDNSGNGETHLQRSLLVSNTAASGAGIYNDFGLFTRVWLTDTAVVYNSASNEAGGIFNRGQLSLTNVTVSNNHLNAGLGAAIDSNGWLRMVNVTVAANTVANASSSSATSFGGFTSIRNTVVANSGFDNCSGNVISAGYNLSSDGSCNFFNQPTDANNSDARLGGLQLSTLAYDTYTNQPLRDSPLLNRIPSALCGSAHDQRGVPRPQGDACDIGAHEVMPVDLGLTASSTPASLPAGSTLNVVLTAANAGPAIATGIVVTSDLPAGMVLKNCDGALACVSSSGRLTITLGALSTGASAQVTVRLTPQQTGDFVLGFGVAGNEWEPQWANNAASVHATVVKSADISVSLTGTPAVLPNTTFTISVLVTNNGAFAADPPVFTLTLPAEVTFVQADGSNWNCSVAAGVVTCAAQSPLQARVMQSVVITLQSASSPAALQLIGSAMSSTFDPDISNNTMSMDLMVGTGSKISLPIVLR
jgi:hypothetical protein